MSISRTLIASVRSVDSGGGSGVLFSRGLRFMSERIAVDAALLGSSNSSRVVVPYLAFIHRW